MSKRTPRILNKTDFLEEGLREMFAVEVTPEPPADIAPFAYKSRDAQQKTLIAQRFEEVYPQEEAPVQTMMNALAEGYETFFEAHYAPRDPKADAALMPSSRVSCDPVDGWFAIHFTPFVAYEEGGNIVKRYDPDVDDRLRSMFDDIYICAEDGLNVWSAPNKFCGKNEYMLRAFNPFLLLQPLRELIKESGWSTMSDFSCPMLAPDKQAQDGSDIFNDSADYTAYRHARFMAICEDAGSKNHLFSKDHELIGELMAGMPNHVFLSVGDATRAALQVGRGKILNLSIEQLEAEIYEALRLDPPDTPEFNALNMH